MVKPHGGFKPFGALLFLVEQVDFRKPSQQFRSSLGLALTRASSFWFRNKRNFHLRRQFIWYTSVPAPLSVINTTEAFLLVRFVVVSESAAVKRERCSNGISVPQRLPYPDNSSDHRVQPHGKCPRSCSESESQQLQAESLVQGKDGI